MHDRATLDYDLFAYEDYAAPVLSLEDAIKKANELRAEDPRNFYRVFPVDSEMTAFRVEKVSKEEVYTKFWTRFAQRVARFRSFTWSK